MIKTPLAILLIQSTMLDAPLELIELPQFITMPKKKSKKIRDLINTGKYDADLAKYIPGLMELAI